MCIKAVLFDLDGTLLSMDQDQFIKTYLDSLAKHLIPYGYSPDAFTKALWNGTGRMIKNDGSKTNEAVFWEAFREAFPDKDIDADQVYFDSFYENEFDKVKDIVARFEPLSLECIDVVKSRGLRVILATNPLFPSVATSKRIAWAGLSESDFDIVTTYENSTYSKPSLGYYREILDRAKLAPQECLMVGNDVSDDMVARDLGMKVFLLTDRLINRDEVDISQYPNGSFKELINYIKSL